MGIYGNKVINREYTSDLFYHDLNISFSIAESAIDHIWFTNSILNEDNSLYADTPIDVQYDEKAKREKEESVNKEKEKLGYRFKEMLVSFMKWVKQIWDKLIEAVKKALDKVRDLTLQDKALKALFDKGDYSDVQKARDNGWKGLLYEGTVMCVPATAGDSEIVRLIRKRAKYTDPKNINKIVDDISKSQTIDTARDQYDKLKTECKKISEQNWVHSPVDIANRGGDIISKIFKEDQDYRALFCYMNIRNPKNSKFGWPDQKQFEQCKGLALGGEKYCNGIRKDFYNDNIKTLEEFVNSDIDRVLNHKLEVNDLQKESNQIMGLYYKGMLLSDKTQLSLAQKICTEVVSLINFQIKTSIGTYLKILTGVKAFNITHKEKKA